MDNTPKSKKKKSLADIASESLILILQLRSSNDYGNASSLKKNCTELFDRFETEARSNAIDNEKITLSKFALVAFLDETIISSSWNQKEQWLAEPLQIMMFDTFNAGEEFFTNLNQLRQRSSGNKDTLEIYYLCLALGFKGKYQLQSPENLRRVIDDLNMELHPEMYNTIDAISPHAKPKEGMVQAAGSGMPVWVYPAGAIVIFVIVYLIFSLSISGAASDVSDLINKIIS
ncbi:MAG: DotU family type IV/VI secretion system protein [Ignavibacteriales bacterium]|nr:MAG: DotU family type IV/VI secretion system protein [Ignavibacteriales bacterium]